MPDFADLTADHDIAVADAPGILAGWRERHLVTVELMREPLDIVLPEGHPLAAKAELTPADVVDENWIGTTEGYPFDRILQRIGVLTGHEAHIVQRFIDNSIVEVLVAAGHGIAILPRFTTRDRENGLVTRPLVGVRSERGIWAIMRPDRAVRPSVRLVVDALRDEATAFFARTPPRRSWWSSSAAGAYRDPSQPPRPRCAAPHLLDHHAGRSRGDALQLIPQRLPRVSREQRGVDRARDRAGPRHQLSAVQREAKTSQPRVLRVGQAGEQTAALEPGDELAEHHPVHAGEVGHLLLGRVRDRTAQPAESSEGVELGRSEPERTQSRPELSPPQLRGHQQVIPGAGEWSTARRHRGRLRHARARRSASCASAAKVAGISDRMPRANTSRKATDIGPYAS